MKKDIDILTPVLPPYNVVASCVTLGFNRPEDSPWKQIPRESAPAASELLPCDCADRVRRGSQWSHLKACRRIEIFIHRCLFNSDGSSQIYRVGQCPACHTIYWSED